MSENKTIKYFSPQFAKITPMTEYRDKTGYRDKTEYRYKTEYRDKTQY